MTDFNPDEIESASTEINSDLVINIAQTAINKNFCSKKRLYFCVSCIVITGTLSAATALWVFNQMI